MGKEGEWDGMRKMEGDLSWISDLDVVAYDVDELDDFGLKEYK